MKKYILLFFVVGSFVSCLESDGNVNSCIPDIYFNVSKSLNLPESSGLLVPGGYAVYENLGHSGIIVYRNTDTSFLAFDLQCPHVSILNCSLPMDTSDFPELKNSCDSDGYFYDFRLGYSTVYTKDANGNHKALAEGERVCDMKEYSVILDPQNILHIRNF